MAKVQYAAYLLAGWLRYYACADVLHTYLILSTWKVWEIWDTWKTETSWLTHSLTHDTTSHKTDSIRLQHNTMRLQSLL